MGGLVFCAPQQSAADPELAVKQSKVNSPVSE
jgi:hypothetical protein